MKEGKVKETIREIAEKRIEDRQTIHINLVSQLEMKAHTKEMRSENDRKFVECLMAQGLTKLEATERVKIWSSKWDSEKHGI